MYSTFLKTNPHIATIINCRQWQNIWFKINNCIGMYYLNFCNACLKKEEISTLDFNIQTLFSNSTFNFNMYSTFFLHDIYFLTFQHKTRIFNICIYIDVLGSESYLQFFGLLVNIIRDWRQFFTGTRCLYVWTGTKIGTQHCAFTLVNE